MSVSRNPLNQSFLVGAAKVDIDSYPLLLCAMVKTRSGLCTEEITPRPSILVENLEVVNWSPAARIPWNLSTDQTPGFPYRSKSSPELSLSHVWCCFLGLFVILICNPINK